MKLIRRSADIVSLYNINGSYLGWLRLKSSWCAPFGTGKASKREFCLSEHTHAGNARQTKLPFHRLSIFRHLRTCVWPCSGGRVQLLSDGFRLLFEGRVKTQQFKQRRTDRRGKSIRKHYLMFKRTSLASQSAILNLIWSGVYPQCLVGCSLPEPPSTGEICQVRDRAWLSSCLHCYQNGQSKPQSLTAPYVRIAA